MKRIEDLSLNTRVLIATIIALLFFIPYSYLIAPKESVQKEQNVSSSTASSTSFDAPKVTNTQNNIEIKPQNSDEIIARIKSEHFDIEIDHLGRISQYYLKDKRFMDEHKRALALFPPLANPKPLEIRFADPNINAEAFKTRYTADKDEINLTNTPQTLTLTQKLGELVVVKKITFHPNGAYNLEINLNAQKQYFISPGTRPQVASDQFVFMGALILEKNKIVTKIEDGEARGSEYFKEAKILAMVDRYYTSLMYDIKNSIDVVISQDEHKNPQGFIQANGNFKIDGYIGGKEVKVLASLNEELKAVVEYGFITFFAKPLFYLLEWLHEITGNWGWAIVLLTIIVRIILYPLTHKGMVSMQKLKDIAPKLKEIQEKYKGDPQKMQLHMMELYKKHGVNPFGGCFPLLLQMPIFFAIYRVLYNAIELKGADWILWIDDLSAMDPYFILPIIMGATMFWQQKITPTTFTDPIQQKIFTYMPLIFTIFFITFPAGLVLYWLVNNIASIIQQYIINKLFEKKRI